MAPKTDSHKPGEKPAAARKGRPSFEVPADAGMPESAAGWVYREPETPAFVSKTVPAKLAARAGSTASSSGGSNSDKVLAAATQSIVFGWTAVGFAALATFSLLEVPMAASRMIMPQTSRSH